MVNEISKIAKRSKNNFGSSVSELHGTIPSYKISKMQQSVLQIHLLLRRVDENLHRVGRLSEVWPETAKMSKKIACTYRYTYPNHVTINRWKVSQSRNTSRNPTGPPAKWSVAKIPTIQYSVDNQTAQSLTTRFKNSHQTIANNDR